jgi:hypothetical protein
MLTYWVEVGLYVVASLVFTALIVTIMILATRSRKLANLLVQSSAQNVALRQKLSELTASGESKKLEQTEGFVKFISESRQWAFDYIEDVQKSIEELRDYFEMFGFDGNEEQREELRDRINHVTTFLPKDNDLSEDNDI